MIPSSVGETRIEPEVASCRRRVAVRPLRSCDSGHVPDMFHPPLGSSGSPPNLASRQAQPRRLWNKIVAEAFRYWDSRTWNGLLHWSDGSFARSILTTSFFQAGSRHLASYESFARLYLALHATSLGVAYEGYSIKSDAAQCLRVAI
jgi:hypothetical protein